MYVGTAAASGRYVPGVLSPTDVATMTGADRTGADRPIRARNFAGSAVSPLWFMLLTIGLGLGSIWVAYTRGARFIRIIQTSESWVFMSYEWDLNAAAWIAVGLAVGCYLSWLLWMSVIGSNAGTYGLGLVILATVPWYLPILYLPFIGVIIVFVLQVFIYFWAWREFITKLWEAAGLPSLFALMGWLGYPLGFVLIISPEPLSLLAPIPIYVQIGFVFIAQLAVTIIQHLQISKDHYHDKHG